ncbi:DUF3467 domain-containing protein [Phycicoccus sp.]|uniref:DUF3467 domain-containing protein n=1 Tax=Phycicoccus sp. TaxID=1902410 RepID=UPI002B9B340D|nr:DUF3467 domain-containing protein [Phycicoccus sp.]HMM93969.1 DUF3467 domain-containing protein [Phycicoccus sp.]
MPDMSEQDDQGPEFNIQISLEQRGGVWSNLARVSHSPYEFTIDFMRVDFNDFEGVVVQRVNMSPLMISQLIEALQDNWQKYAQKSLPQEVYGDGHEVPGSPGGEAEE